MKSWPALWTIGAAGALIVVCLGSVGVLTPSMGSPSLTAPASMPLVLPILLSEVWGSVVFIAWPLAFVAWAHPLLRGSGRFPKRSFVAWALVLLLSTGWFAGSWRLGLEYQGAAFTWSCLASSLILASGVLYLGWSCSRQPSFRKSLAAHWLLFAWVVTYAFPYLGETP